MFQHPDAQALYRAVLAEPDDDAPRLILADWLDENDEPERAEYIRLACAIERDKWSDESIKLRQRRDALGMGIKAQSDKLPTIPKVEWGGYSRGFCQSVSVSSRSPLQPLTRVRQLAPVTHVTLLTKELLGSLAKLELLSYIRGVHIGASIHPMEMSQAAIKNFFNSPHLKELHSLAIGFRAGSSVCRYIADCQACSTLKFLDINNYSYGSEFDITELCSSSILPLTDLRLRGCPIRV